MDLLNNDLFHYTGCGLDNIYLASGVNFTKSEYGDGYSINDVDELECLITLLVAFKASPLTGKEVRYLRIQTDYSQKELAGKLGVTDQTVSLWERGNQDIQRAESLILRSLALDHTQLGSPPMDTLITHIDTTDFDPEAWEKIVLGWNEPKSDDDKHWGEAKTQAHG